MIDSTIEASHVASVAHNANEMAQLRTHKDRIEQVRGNYGAIHYTTKGLMGIDKASLHTDGTSKWEPIGLYVVKGKNHMSNSELLHRVLGPINPVPVRSAAKGYAI
jgi:hypothetical protein